MAGRDVRIDAFIARAQPFARPILTHLRAVVHDACPEVVETIKWGMPFFEYEGTLCHMAAFKQHCAFGFWKGKLLLGASSRNAEAMGDFGRITVLTELPTRARIKDLVKQAMRLNASGTKRTPRSKAASKPSARVPKDLRDALARNRKAAEHFKAFPPSYRRDYIEWLTEAKTEATRARRLATAMEWVAEGKSRNWKYMKR